MGSFSLSGGVEVFGFISPSNTSDQYPVIDPLYGIDGLRNVNLLSDLDSIPLLRRRAGMVVGVSGTTYYKLNSPPWNSTISDWSLFNSGGFTGGTVTGDTIFTNGLTATTFSASTYLGLPSDVYVSGYSYSNNTFTIERSFGNPNLTAVINDVTGLTVNGDLNVTGTTFSDIISASTYQNLPLDIFVTGGTFSGGVITFENNSGGTFGVSGISSFDTFVTGFTYGDNTLTILQNSGNSFSVLVDAFTGLTVNGDLNVTGTTYTDSISANTYQNLPIDPNTFVTGFSYNNNTFTIGDNLGSTFDATFNDVTGLTINGDLSVTGNTLLEGLTATTISAGTYQNLPLDVFVTGGTYSAGTTTFTNNRGGTFDVNGFLKYFISATTPTGATDGDRWFNTNDGRELVYVTDQDGSQWVVPNGTSSFFGSLSAITISATTYLNLPIDIRVTGGTYSNGTATFTNNTGGTFNVSGFYTGATDVFVTGATYNDNTFTYTNNTGGTFNVSFDILTGLTINGDLNVTGTTYTDTISASTYQNLPINYGSFGLTIDGGGSDITIGNKGYAIIPYNATITGWSVVGNTSGSCVIDVWKTTSGNIPTSGDTITGTEKPTLSSQQINSDLNLTTWTTSVSQYDVIGFNVDSTSGLTRVNLSIYIIKQ